MSAWDDYAVAAKRADYGAHGYAWNFDPSAGAPRLRAFVKHAQLIAYPDAWELRLDAAAGRRMSDVTGDATSYADAQHNAHVAYCALKRLWKVSP